jgi:hypothetical protein
MIRYGMLIAKPGVIKALAVMAVAIPKRHQDEVIALGEMAVVTKEAVTKEAVTKEAAGIVVLAVVPKSALIPAGVVMAVVVAVVVTALVPVVAASPVQVMRHRRGRRVAGAAPVGPRPLLPIFPVADVLLAAEVIPVEVVLAAAAVVDVEVVVVVKQALSSMFAEKNMMKSRLALHTLLAALVFSGLPVAYAAQPTVAGKQLNQRHFDSPEKAAEALSQAVRAEDPAALLSVVGADSKAWLFSGDRQADRADWQRFLAAYDAAHAFQPISDGRVLLQVGQDAWPFPAPIIKRTQGWSFDTRAGREEILNRRIGRNELSTIQALRAVVDAQREYAAGDLDGNGSHDYAQRFISTAGKRDGLYWPNAEGVAESPLGPKFADAALGNKGKPAPYHGYHFRILKSQGKSAAGGAYDYLVNDRMIGGFAVIAYPAKYGVSGVMTFIVNHDATVYQRNMGKTTAEQAAKVQRFNPDAAWQKAE